MKVYDVVAVNKKGELEFVVSENVMTITGAQACAAGFNGTGEKRLVAIVRERQADLLSMLEPSVN